MAIDRLRYWISMVGTTQPEEMDCDQLFEILEIIVEAAVAGQDISEAFPAVAIHMNHCPACQDLYDTLIALTAEPAP